MKYLIIAFSFISLTCAFEVHLRDGITPKKLPPIVLNPDVLPKINWEELRTILEKGELKAGSVQADVTNYTLAILANVANILIHDGYDPMELSDTHISLFPGSLDLTHGYLQELSTITVSEEVIARYSHATGILDLTLPLAFNTLLASYDFHIQILLLGFDGGITAKISDLRVDLHLGFNFTNHHAFVDNADVKNTGSIDIEITGFGILDYILDIMTKALTTFFHTLILSVVDLVIYFPVQNIVTSINDLLDSIFPQNSTVLMMN